MCCTNSSFSFQTDRHVEERVRMGSVQSITSDTTEQSDVSRNNNSIDDLTSVNDYQMRSEARMEMRNGYILDKGYNKMAYLSLL